MRAKVAYVMRHYALSLLIVGAITVVCLVDWGNTEMDVPQISYGDKVAHWGFYVLLSAAIVWDDWRTHHKLRKGVLAFWAIGMATLWGGGIEIVQGLTPYRSAEWADWAADALGATMGTLVAMALCARGQQHKK